jgi:hypothetical protein
MIKLQEYYVIEQVQAHGRDGFRTLCIEAKLISKDSICKLYIRDVPVDYLEDHFDASNPSPGSLILREFVLEVRNRDYYGRRDSVSIFEKPEAFMIFRSRKDGSLMTGNSVPIQWYEMHIEDTRPVMRMTEANASAPDHALDSLRAGMRNGYASGRCVTSLMLQSQHGKSAMIRTLIDKMRAEGHTIYAIPKASMNADEPFKFPPDEAQPWSNKAMRTFQNGINSEAQTAINAAENGIKALENIISSKSLKIGQLEGQRESAARSYESLYERTKAQLASLQGELDKLRQSNSDKRKRIKQLQDNLDKSGHLTTLEGNTSATNVHHNYIDLVARIAEALGLSGAVTNDNIVSAVKSIIEGRNIDVETVSRLMDFRNQVKFELGLSEFANNNLIVKCVTARVEDSKLAKDLIGKNESNVRIITEQNKELAEHRSLRSAIVAALGIGGWMTDSVIVDHCKNVARNSEKYVELRKTFNKFS